MSDTPQTDALRAQYRADSDYSEDFWLDRIFQECGKLEMQRDALAKEAGRSLSEIMDERDQLREENQRLALSVAKLAEELDDWKNAAKGAENPHPDELHCTCVPLLQASLKQVRSERDEARQLARELFDLKRWAMLAGDGSENKPLAFPAWLSAMETSS